MTGKESPSTSINPSTIHPGDHQKTSPLWVAAWKGHVDIVVVLLRSKADPHLTLGLQVGFHGKAHELSGFHGIWNHNFNGFHWISMDSIGFQWIL